MKIERTPTYIRLYIGRYYITRTKKDESMEEICRIIENQNKLSSKHLNEAIDYLIAVRDLERHRL